MSPFERVIRYILGILILTWAVAGGAYWGYFAIYLIYSSSFNTCWFYKFVRQIKNVRE